MQVSKVDLSWMIDGACVGDERNLWFPDAGGSTRAARQVCARCSVKQQCLDYALVHEEFGIWGGMSPEQRNRYRREQRIVGRRRSRV